MKTFFRVFFSIIFSIILFGFLSAFGCIKAVQVMLGKGTINEIIDKVDVIDIIKSDDGYNEIGRKLKEEAVEAGLPEIIFDEFIEAEPFEEFIKDYSKNVFNYVFYGEDYKKLKAKDISDLVNDNIDDIVADLREKEVDGIEELTDDRVAEIKANVDKMAVNLEKEFADVQDFMENSENRIIFEIVNFIVGNILTIIFVVLIVFFTTIIILINLKDYNFSIWLAVVYCSTSFIFLSSGISSLFINSGNEVFENMSRDLHDLVTTLFHRLGLALLIYGLILLFIAIMFVIIGIFGKRKNNKKETNQNLNNFENKSSDSEKLVQLTETKIEETPVENVEEQSTEKTYEEDLKVEEAVETKTLKQTKKEKLEVIYCSECGTKLTSKNDFCHNCGKKIK